MQPNTESQQKSLLERIARRAMMERGLKVEFSPEAQAQLEKIKEVTPKISAGTIDQTDLLWTSIDNDDSKDLDQLSVGLEMPSGDIKVLVAIAEVDCYVQKDSAIDLHAKLNTASIYTAAKVFPMLPERLSTDLTSLNQDVARYAMVTEMTFDKHGNLVKGDVYRAIVKNVAKLTYHKIGAWLAGEGELPEAAVKIPGLGENLRLQDSVAVQLKNLRHNQGALSLESTEARPTFDGEKIKDLELQEQNRATNMIEEFMIAANGVSARYLAAKKFPSIRRVVRSPKRWDRLIVLAKELGTNLPTEPDSKALEQFLLKQKAENPMHFPDVSLSVIKLLGPGEYVAEEPGVISAGHFGLAIKDYAHSTAPNRRYTDLVTQRLLKAAIMNAPCPYTSAELEALAAHCTDREDIANRVERQVSKSAAALLLQSKLGERFDGVVTGVTAQGCFVRLISLPVDGRLVKGSDGVDVGDHIRVQLAMLDVDRGFIDFNKVEANKS